MAKFRRQLQHQWTSSWNVILHMWQKSHKYEIWIWKVVILIKNDLKYYSVRVTEWEELDSQWSAEPKVQWAYLKQLWKGSTSQISKSKRTNINIPLVYLAYMKKDKCNKPRKYLMWLFFPLHVASYMCGENILPNLQGWKLFKVWNSFNKQQRTSTFVNLLAGKTNITVSSTVCR